MTEAPIRWSRLINVHRGRHSEREGEKDSYGRDGDRTRDKEREREREGEGEGEGEREKVHAALFRVDQGRHSLQEYLNI